MITVSASQLIYTRVEAEYSPRRQPGYQMVYSSPSLSPAEVALVEQRVQCFKPPRPTDARLQCFPLLEGRTAIGRTVQIRADPIITDRSARPGAFLAHCLVLAAAEFALLEHNPFPLFEAFPFLDDPALLVSDYLGATAVAEPATVVVPDQSSFATSWSEAKALKRIGVGLRAARLVRARQSFALIGPAEDIAAALRTSIERLPPARRKACSFDTCADGCAVAPGTYWAVGMAQPHSGAAFTLIDASAHHRG